MNGTRSIFWQCRHAIVVPHFVICLTSYHGVVVFKMSMASTVLRQHPHQCHKNLTSSAQLSMGKGATKRWRCKCSCKQKDNAAEAAATKRQNCCCGNKKTMLPRLPQQKDNAAKAAATKRQNCCCGNKKQRCCCGNKKQHCCCGNK